MTASTTDDLASAERRIQELAKELSQARGELTQARGELAEARERQATTAKILGVISDSRGELRRVFTTLAVDAARLCNAFDAAIYRIDGEVLRVVAHHGPIDIGPVGDFTLPLTRDIAIGRAVIERRLLHIADLQAEGKEYPEGRDYALRWSFHTQLAVPLRKAGDALGVIVIRRAEVRPFTDEQIELLRSFADQAAIAIENTRLFEAQQASKRELQESLEYQTATSEVLSVISRSPNALQPVLDSIVETAKRLCQSDRAQFFKLENGKYHLAAQQGTNPDFLKYLAENPISVDPQSGSTTSLAVRPTTSRAVRERRTIHVPDVLADPEFAGADQLGRARSVLAVPLVRDRVVIGVVTVAQDTVRPFTARQIELIETFASQALIAIENTRLFEAEQASKRALQESLEYQTAISEVLAVISRSPSDLQPVLQAIVETAARLCQADKANIRRKEGASYRTVASIGFTQAQRDFIEQSALLLDRSTIGGRVALDHETVHIVDVLEDRDLRTDILSGINFRTGLGVPLLRKGELIGLLLLAREKQQPYSRRQIALIETFADQAVIAIENTRLFEAEQASKRELQESLEYQTATSEVLSVISRSPDQLQPVLDVITETAVRLCQATHGHVRLLREDGAYHVAAHQIPDSELLQLMRDNPFRPGMDSVSGRVALQGVTVHVADVGSDPDISGFQRHISDKVRTAMGVPLKQGGKVVGIISVWHTQVRPFTERQIKLVETFADQAVIAINNVGLFEEVQARTRELTEALEQQTATADVLKVISRSALDLQRVLDALVESAARLCDANDAAIFQVFGDSLRLVADYRQTFPMAGAVGQLTLSLVRGRIVGRAVIDRRTIHVADALAEADEYPESSKIAQQYGHRTMLAVPLVHAGEAIGVIYIRRAEVHPFTERQIELVNTFADQAVIAIENTRLFEEVQARTRELAKTVEDLEIASQHKNQFVANMSHELRTPLAAILGYAELIQEGFYEPQGPKSLDALTRIRSNGKHLLGLINTVLDIAKIESGQFTLNMSEYAIESVVETVRAATESLAQNKKLTLTTSVDKSLPIGLGDEQRLTQVLLNLVGNAIKFTDAGEVSIAAGARNGRFAVSVTDTGPGIPLDQQDRIFDQFHQVDSSLTKAKGGTGLGLAIAKQIVEMHGGRIWVVSTPGKGSTFQMELPTRAEYRKPTLDHVN